MNGVKIVASPYPMRTSNGDMTIKDVVAIVLRNAGTATVNLWDGLYTLDPKETVSLNVTETGLELELLSVPVKFDTSTGSVQKLQVLALKKIAC